jgi:hypothetical protein
MAQTRVWHCATVLLLFGENQPARALGDAKQYQHGQDAEERQQNIVATRQMIRHSQGSSNR